MPRRLLHPVRNWQAIDQDERMQIRNIVVVIVPFLLLAIGAIGLLLATFTQPLRAEPPFVFSAHTYEPINGDVCPGDTLEWPVAFTIQRAPVMVISVRSIWDVEKNQTAQLPPGSTFNAGSLNFTNYTETTHVSRTLQVVLPPLPPGSYQIRSAAQEFNSQAAAYSVPFKVKEGCPPLPESTETAKP